MQLSMLIAHQYAFCLIVNSNNISVTEAWNQEPETHDFCHIKQKKIDEIYIN